MSMSMSDEINVEGVAVVVGLMIFTWFITMMSCTATVVKSYYVRPVSGQYCVAATGNSAYDPCVTQPLPIEDAKDIAENLNRVLGNHASWK
jgi:hypothetical protein